MEKINQTINRDDVEKALAAVIELIQKQKPMPKEFVEMINEHFWELVD